uniref:hypothetical protein n=1 Tax=Enterococcus faecalis TaxID=1351 RepID=UPI0024788DEC|nr:hypothetical protein [Enterococcus faecalis]
MAREEALKQDKPTSINKGRLKQKKLRPSKQEQYSIYRKWVLWNTNGFKQDFSEW